MELGIYAAEKGDMIVYVGGGVEIIGYICAAVGGELGKVFGMLCKVCYGIRECLNVARRHEDACFSGVYEVAGAGNVAHYAGHAASLGFA